MSRDSKDETAKEGEILLATIGTDSDFDVIGIYVVEIDFSPQEKLDAYLERNPEAKGKNRFKGEEFLEELVSGGFLRESTCGTLHLADYNTASEVWFRSPK